MWWAIAFLYLGVGCLTAWCSFVFHKFVPKRNPNDMDNYLFTIFLWPIDLAVCMMMIWFYETKDEDDVK